MGVAPAIVGTLMMIARFVDAVTDVTMGQIVDRSNLRKMENSNHGFAVCVALWELQHFNFPIRICRNADGI